MSAHVLVVDDEPQICSLLETYLQAEGFETTAVGSAAAGLVEIANRAPDIVLLDLGLPDQSGLDLLGKIREISEVYVMIISARAEEVDKLLGLGLGADDYVTKPFSPREIVARVKAVLRRRHSENVVDNVLRFPGLVIDQNRREVVMGRRPIELSALDFDLLAVLANAPGRVYSRTQLMEKVWGYDFYGESRVVDVHVKSIRAALGDDAGHPSIIGTVRGVGYKFLLGAA